MWDNTSLNRPLQDGGSFEQINLEIHEDLIEKESITHMKLFQLAILLRIREEGLFRVLIVIIGVMLFSFIEPFDIGNPNGQYKAPYAIIYRNLAILGVQGFSALPKHCLQLCCGFFAFAVGINVVKDFTPKRIGKWMPLPTAMAVPFLIGGYFAIDMCVGTLIVFLWYKINSKKAELMVPAVASGLICGDGLWILPSSVLALAKIYPPICMTFLPA
ncbi:metal-nicotianamine transporter YSL1-like [Olea europaea var. sylvestris]|uniref:metal-nicotianamine transporter YSL1-like n=1 Tax=Olea europaea var. sylvestris TaxID=158386 RepID=UPI000C1D2916|nr:metal-nicotianamine transporter YSL1-like [Olea europaea var. sylvestris]